MNWSLSKSAAAHPYQNQTWEPPGVLRWPIFGTHALRGYCTSYPKISKVSGNGNLRHTHNLYKEVTPFICQSFSITTFTKVSPEHWAKFKGVLEWEVRRKVGPLRGFSRERHSTVVFSPMGMSGVKRRKGGLRTGFFLFFFLRSKV